MVWYSLILNIPEIACVGIMLKFWFLSNLIDPFNINWSLKKLFSSPRYPPISLLIILLIMVSPLELIELVSLNKEPPDFGV